MLVHYVSFLYAGILFSEESSKRIKSRKDKFDIPPEAFAYFFWDRTEYLKGKEILKGKRRNISGRYYPNGILWNKKQIKESEGEHSILYRNMVNNRYNYVVRTRCGNWQPFNKKREWIKILPGT